MSLALKIQFAGIQRQEPNASIVQKRCKRRTRCGIVSASLQTSVSNVLSIADAAALSLGDEVVVNPATVAIPLAGLVAGIAAAKAAAYSQLEVVRASMLSRHVKSGGAKVLQLGGNTKDLYYYPSGTVQVTVVGPDENAALWETAGMNAGVPVRTVKSEIASAVAAQAGSVFDSVVAIDQFSSIADFAEFLKQVKRVLKPGGTFVFIQRVEGSPLASLVRLGGGPATVARSVPDSIADLTSWDFIQWDTASESLDPHAAGVAIKSLEPDSEGSFSADKTVFETMMKKRGGKSGRKGTSKGGFK